MLFEILRLTGVLKGRLFGFIAFPFGSGQLQLEWLDGGTRSLVGFGFPQGLRGFDRGRLFVVPCWRYKLLVGFLKILPGPLMRWGSVYFVRRYRRSKAA